MSGSRQGRCRFFDGKRAIIMALAAASAVVFVLCARLQSGIPTWVRWESSTFSDRTGMYTVALNSKTVSVKYDTCVIWTSPEGVKVQKALSWDVDNDGVEELVLLCWKKGRYGAHRPFWVEKDEDTWSQHLFVYAYSPDKISPKWMSSYIGQDVADMTSNNKEAPDARLWLRGTEDEMTSWVWDSWGFKKEDAEISFCVFGDVLVHEPIYRYGLQNEPDFGFLFENVQQMILDSDVAVINQETPLTDNPAMYGDYPRFGTPVQVGQAIVDAGFDVVTCATNHALDRGVDGARFTKYFFDAHQVVCLGIQADGEGAEKPYALIRRNGVCFALFNYTYGTNGIRIPDENRGLVHLLDDAEKIRGDLAKARSEADFILVFAHWGTEYATDPDEFQQTWTQVFLESGVDVVVGTHPHTLQPYELRTGEDGHQMLVYYSVGNFISAQPYKRCVRGGAAQFTIALPPAGYQLDAYGLQPMTIVWHPGGKYMTE
ncbi:MAG: CapA family protein [Lachnospiraceae bacterium]|nr:CapA family protein [Lachnospiraceae bacterium]